MAMSKATALATVMTTAETLALAATMAMPMAVGNDNDNYSDANKVSDNVLKRQPPMQLDPMGLMKKTNQRTLPPSQLPQRTRFPLRQRRKQM